MHPAPNTLNPKHVWDHVGFRQTQGRVLINRLFCLSTMADVTVGAIFGVKELQLFYILTVK